MSRSEWNISKTNFSNLEVSSSRQTKSNRAGTFFEEQVNSVDPRITNDNDRKVTKLRLSRAATIASSDSFSTELPPRQLRLSRSTTSNSIASSAGLPPRQLCGSACTPRIGADDEDLSPPRRVQIRRSVTPESSPRRLAPSAVGGVHAHFCPFESAQRRVGQGASWAVRDGSACCAEGREVVQVGKGPRRHCGKRPRRQIAA
jgi:hypothetical protein